MNYTETTEYLFTRLPMYSRIGPAAYKKDLTNIIRLCEFLDNPHHQFKSIHVAGTNGKGSVSHMLAAVLQSAGYRTGLYTSPHLRDFRERIKLNGEEIPERFVIDFTEKIKPLIEEIQPSFFEITVAMAFEYFTEQNAEIAVIEVGLGGRLDSTNIITPVLSVITHIGRDHMQMLGDTLEKIAFEKAGIIKESIPVIVGEVLPETLPVFKKVAAEKNAPLIIASEKRQISDYTWKNHELIVGVSEKNKTDHRTYHLDLSGIYQAKNLLTVLEACSQLQQQGWKITEETICKGLSHVKKLTGFSGRWNIIHHNPMVVLDVAHNIDGIKQLIQQVEVTGHRQLHIIIGMVRDKEVENIFSILPKSARYYFTKAQIPRAVSEDELAVYGANAGLKGASFSEVNSALETAIQLAHPDDLILVCGSVFLVGEVVIPTEVKTLK